MYIKLKPNPLDLGKAAKWRRISYAEWSKMSKTLQALYIVRAESRSMNQELVRVTCSVGFHLSAALAQLQLVQRLLHHLPQEAQEFMQDSKLNETLDFAATSAAVACAFDSAYLVKKSMAQFKGKGGCDLNKMRKGG